MTDRLTKYIIYKVLLAIIFCPLFLFAQQLKSNPDDIIQIMKKVADWQLANPVRFDITLDSGEITEQYSVLWDGTFVRKRSVMVDNSTYKNLNKNWIYLSKLTKTPISFYDLPSQAQQTFTRELQLDPSRIIKIEMCDKNTRGWEMGALYVGLEALAEVTNNNKYIDALKLIANANDWKLGERIYHADDHCVGQMYMYLYSIYNELNMIADIQMQFDWIIKNPHPQSLNYSEGKNRWSWCDALFMSPPVWLYLTNASGDRKYLNYMDDQYWQTYQHLFDIEENLFYRDDRYYIKRETNGEKVFWSRGNGWVLAGLSRMINHFPSDFKHKEKYVNLFQQMMKKIKSIQPKDGMFRASLLDPKSYPVKEASGTAFFLYSAAWGINNGYLNRDTFMPFVIHSWNGLLECIDENGKLGWTQLPGSEPGDVKKESNAPYGVGAFLLAGSELYKLISK